MLEGVLPIKLKFIKADSEKIVDRFYKACIGWIRYKPLLLYITQPDSYNEQISNMRQQLKEVLPKVCAYFDQPDFNNILIELDKYDKNMKKHHSDFLETQRIWAKLMKYLTESEKIGIASEKIGVESEKIVIESKKVKTGKGKDKGQ